MNRGNTEEIREMLEMMHRGKIKNMPPLNMAATVLFAGYVLICMIYLPLCRSEAISGVLLLLTAAMGLLTLRSPWVIGMLAVPAFLLVGVTGSLAVAAVPMAILCGTAYGAFLLLHVRAPWMAAIPLAAFAVGLWVTGKAEEALAAWLFLPAVVTLTLCLRNGMLRVRAICRTAIALAVPLLLWGILTVMSRGGVDVFADLSETVAAARHALAERLATWETGTGENAARVVLEGMEFAMASAVFNVLPGLILAGLAVFAYLVDLVCLTLLRTYERTKYLSARVYILAVSLPSAILFLTGYLLLLILDGGDGAGTQFAAVVTENIYLALLPAMVLVGVLVSIRAFLYSAHRGMMLIGAILAIALFPAAVLTALSLLGAGSVIWQTVRRLFRHRKKPE